jgi:Fe-S-cluster-containing dehydrogenase component
LIDSYAKNILMVNLKKCVGCYVCEVGCQQWNKAPDNEKRVMVKTIGPVGGRIKRDVIYYPAFTRHCDLCANNLDANLPFCAANCPEEAIIFCDEAEAIELVRNSDCRYTIGKAQDNYSV